MKQYTISFKNDKPQTVEAKTFTFVPTGGVVFVDQQGAPVAAFFEWQSITTGQVVIAH